MLLSRPARRTNAHLLSPVPSSPCGERMRCARAGREPRRRPSVGADGRVEGSEMATKLGIDIAATGIKGAPVDTATGELVAPRFRIPTPQPATPTAVADTVAEIA